MSIEDRLGNKAEAWIAENPGDKLVGQVTAVTTLDGTYGEYPCIEIEEKGTSKLRSWHAFDTVAKNEVKKQNPQPGDEIGAIFMGLKLKKGAPADSKKSDDSFKDWHVLVEKTTKAVEAPTWDDEVGGTRTDDDLPYGSHLPQGQAPDSFDDVEPF